MIRQFVSQYLNFTKKERNGTLLLLVLIAILTVLPFIFPLFIKKKPYEHDTFKKEIATLKIKQADTAGKYQWKKNEEDPPAYYQQPGKPYPANQEWKGVLFQFDPNTISETGWQKLGIRGKTIATIQNYLSKGGKFNQPEDIKKIWGLDAAIAEKLMPFVRIEKPAFQKDGSSSNSSYNRVAYEKTTYQPTIVDVNVADSAALIALPGIGSKLSQRIINFRERLGGFYNIEQVGETFGLPDSTFQKIKSRLLLSTAPVKQININTATLDELKAHPYLRYNLANAIVQYRTQHGNFSSTNELKKIRIVTDEVYAKASPYLKIN